MQKKNEKEKRVLKFLYRNPDDKPVYIDNTGKYWMDIDPREGHGMQFYDLFMNIEHETPDFPKPDNLEFEFDPERILDPADSELKCHYIIQIEEEEMRGRDKMLVDLLIFEAILLFLGRFFGWEGFFVVLFFEIIYTFCWVTDHY